jgi:hypothetical protein
MKIAVLLVTSNENWVVPASFDERRFAIIDMGEGRKDDNSYFAAIDCEMKKGGREALLHHLLNFDLSKVNLRVIPRTSALLDQQIHSSSSEQAWWLDVLQRGKLPSMSAPNECAKSHIFDSYIRHATRQGTRHRSTEVMIGKFLHSYVGPTLATVRHEFKVQGTDKATRERYYVFPPLSECRAYFAKKLRQDLNWDDPEEGWENEAETF